MKALLPFPTPKTIALAAKGLQAEVDKIHRNLQVLRTPKRR